MAKYKESARYHIVSVRVSKAEREILEKISLESKKNVSDLMREALQLMIPCRHRPRAAGESSTRGRNRQRQH